MNDKIFKIIYYYDNQLRENKIEEETKEEYAKNKLKGNTGDFEEMKHLEEKYKKEYIELMNKYDHLRYDRNQAVMEEVKRQIKSVGGYKSSDMFNIEMYAIWINTMTDDLESIEISFYQDITLEDIEKMANAMELVIGTPTHITLSENLNMHFDFC